MRVRKIKHLIKELQAQEYIYFSEITSRENMNYIDFIIHNHNISLQLLENNNLNDAPKEVYSLQHHEEFLRAIKDAFSEPIITNFFMNCLGANEFDRKLVLGIDLQGDVNDILTDHNGYSISLIARIFRCLKMAIDINQHVAMPNMVIKPNEFISTTELLLPQLLKFQPNNSKLTKEEHLFFAKLNVLAKFSAFLINTQINEIYVLEQSNSASLLDHLHNIEHIIYSPSPELLNNDFIDFILNIERVQNSANKQDIDFAVNKVFKDHPKVVKDLGATDMDMAIMLGAEKEVQNIIEGSEWFAGEVNLYEAASTLRCLSLKQQLLNDQNYCNNIKVAADNVAYNGVLTLTNLTEQYFKYNNKPDDQVKKILFYINGNLSPSANVKYVQKVFQEISSNFDKIIAFGSGDREIDFDYLLTIINHEIENYNLDYAVIYITVHGELQGQYHNTINRLPDDIALNTVYIFNSCYGGQYDWNKDKALWIATSGENERSSTIFTNPFEFNLSKERGYSIDLKAFSKAINSEEGLVGYYAHYITSTPYVQGSYKKFPLCKITAKTLFDLIEAGKFNDDTPLTTMGNSFSYLAASSDDSEDSPISDLSDDEIPLDVNKESSGIELLVGEAFLGLQGSILTASAEFN